MVELAGIEPASSMPYPLQSYSDTRLVWNVFRADMTVIITITCHAGFQKTLISVNKFEGVPTGLSRRVGGIDYTG